MLTWKCNFLKGRSNLRKFCRTIFFGTDDETAMNEYFRKTIYYESHLLNRGEDKKGKTNFQSYFDLKNIFLSLTKKKKKIITTVYRFLI